MIKPTLEEAARLAESGPYRNIPVCMEMFSDMTTPLRVLKILKNISNHCYMLESAADSENWGRYTFLGYDPTMEVTCSNGILNIRNGNIATTVETKEPQRYIRQIIEDNLSPRIEGFPTFTGGLMGYFSYDYLKYAEPTLRLDADDEEGFNDVDLMLFDKVICFDNYRQKILLIVNARTEDLETSYNQAVSTLRQMADLIKNSTPKEEKPGRCTAPLTPLFNEEAYCAMVEKAKYHIREGDIFQVVLSNRLEAPYTGSLLNAYRVLRTTNPSPYMFYLSSDDIELAGASPETLVKLEDGVLHTFPLAGTRPRGKTPEEDKALEEELLHDPKELAEHNMLVDLGRNDIGKISEFGSVEVEKYLSIERYSHVMHIGSVVRGRIRSECDALDAIDAVLPAGTLSGAPKLRACQIINDLENNKRGVYGGAIGYLDFTGNMDTCIAIRLVFKKNGKVFVRSGAGIVADSVPEKEYQECINKAQATVSALTLATEEEYL